MVDAPEGRGPRSASALALLGLLALILFAGFIALGTWQVKRLAWKRDLIARVDQRVHAPPVAPPPRASWPTVSAARDEYLHVRVQGRYLPRAQSLVFASTELGNGHWVMTPLRTDDGSIVLVNRGFVPDGACKAGVCTPPAGPVQVAGLLRISQTWAFLRHNDPAHDRWYSRDVQALARAHGLHDVAPYFIDADTAAPPAPGARPQWPRGGMTVIVFPNNHLVYLVTWYLLALMVAAAAVRFGREEWRLRQPPPRD